MANEGSIQINEALKRKMEEEDRLLKKTEQAESAKKGEVVTLERDVQAKKSVLDAATKKLEGAKNEVNKLDTEVRKIKQDHTNIEREWEQNARKRAA